MSNKLLFQSETSPLKLKPRNSGSDMDKSSTQLSDQPSSPNKSETTTSIPSSSTTSFTTSPSGSVNLTTPSFNDTTNSSYGTTSTSSDSGAEGAVIAVIIVIIAVTSFLVLTYFCLKKKGKLYKLPCYRPVTRGRRSSTSSSRRALEEHEVMDNSVRPKPEGRSDDMFTIDDIATTDDYENTADPQEGKEEYYYDEVFGQSQFEDETTNNAMRHLYSDQPEDEMLDLDFETLGIKIDDYIPESSRKNMI